MTPTLAQRRKQFTLSSVAGVVLIGAILLLVNILANWVFFRLDLTHSHAYSLSASSKKLVRGLDDPIVIKAFFTPDLPAPYNVYERYVRDMLSEYHSASKGKVRFEFVLPYPPQDFEKRAQEAGLNPLQMEQQGSDQLAIRRVFMGMVLYYRDKSEAIPVVKNIEQLEYDLTSKMARMAVHNKKTIAFTVGHGEPEWVGPKSHITPDLTALYDLHAVDLSAGTTAPIQADGLLVVGPTKKWDDKALWAVDQAIMRGIPVAFLVDSKSVLTNQFIAGPLDTGLVPFLLNYGFQLGHQLIYDAQAETIGISQTVAGFVIPMQMQYPYIPVITHFDTVHPLARGLEVLALPFVTTVDPAPQRPAGLSYTSLFETSARSWLQPANTYSISPTQIPLPKPDDPHGPYTVGSVMEGTFTSYFQGKPAPFPSSPVIGTSAATSVIVIGTAHLIDPNLPEFRGAQALMANIMAWVSKDDVLLGIRSKGEILKPLKPLKEGQRQLIKCLGIGLPPLLAASMGLVLWRRRQAWRQRLSVWCNAFSPR